MAKNKGPERVKRMTDVLRVWQALERQAINDTAEIIENTKSPLVRMIMEIIQHDSAMHHRVQQFLIDSVTEEAVTVTREDIAEIWDKIEAHDKIEKRTIGLAKELREESWSPVHKQLFDYLLTDEQKHDTLLEQLNELKVGLSKVTGA